MADPGGSTRGRGSFADAADIDEFVVMLERFERGEISAEQWRRFRLLRGTYGQRQDEVQMLRLKIPQGIVHAAQLRSLADVVEEFARGFAHVTTRQNIQLHFLKLADVEVIMRRMAAAGITTREACGNSVRNITACPFAGVAVDELFDVTPWAEALTRYLLRHPLAAILPRKFKIAFEGCPEDHAFASINDLGWTARVRPRDGQPERGFRLTVGGGTSILPVSGRVLLDFVPAREMLAVAEAILRVYHRLGDHEHKHRNRMKFLIKALGWDRWRDEVLTTWDEVQSEGGPRWPFEPTSVEEAPPPAFRPSPPSPEEMRSMVSSTWLKGPGLAPSVLHSRVDAQAVENWRATNIRRQRQQGFVLALVRLPLGDITAGQLRAMAVLTDAYGDGTVRLTPDQNLFIRWIADADVEDLFARLAAAGLAEPGASTISDVTSCPGAESCKLAVTQSRGLGRLLVDELLARPELAALAADASLKISGCPNGCGQHHVATLGFQGSLRKVEGRAVPQYFVMVGGAVASEGATFARLAAKIPARRVGAAVERLLEWYGRERLADESPRAFFARVPVAAVRPLLADLETFSADTACPDDYVDLADTAAFVPGAMAGECAT